MQINCYKIFEQSQCNPLSCIAPYFIILLCLTPDDFTCQGKSAGWVHQTIELGLKLSTFCTASILKLQTKRKVYESLYSHITTKSGILGSRDQPVSKRKQGKNKKIIPVLRRLLFGSPDFLLTSTSTTLIMFGKSSPSIATSFPTGLPMKN